MNTEISGVILMFLITIALAIPLGKYIGKVYEGEKTWPDRFLNPLDKIFFKLSGINPNKNMNWKQHLVALLIINLVWFIFSMLVLMNMSWLPLNPDGNPSMSADLGFQYFGEFYFQYQFATLFRRNRRVLFRAIDPDVIPIHQCGNGYGNLCRSIHVNERKNH